ncbi:MAG: tail-specific protease [Bacteroidetes bacterium]|nr:tail-specific protease [Bacteroidota bacterium]
MKIKGSLFLSFVVIIGLAATFYPQVDMAEKESVIMQTLLNGLGQLHYQPQAINDEFSQKVYSLYLDRIDSGHRFLTQADVEQLKIYELQIDDESNNGTYEFFDLSVELLNAALNKTETYYQEILAKPFDFSKNEMVELDGEKKEFAENNEELKEYWRKSMKYEVLTRLTSEIEAQEKIEEESEKKNFEELEKETREKVLEVYDGWYKRMRKMKRTDRLSNYLNTITRVFDPHTGYYEPIDKQNFDIGMSGTFEGIGARLQTQDDHTKVSDIIVGGPAWKQKQLEKNDVILKVAQAGEEAVDIKGMVINDVVQLIRGDKETEVLLTVKKVDGTVVEIPIVRDVVIVEEGFAKSLILDGKSEDEKIGYIYLPRFYADFKNKDGRFCAADVAKELDKLKSENVDGVVLDLRNNGGGSLRDVVKMSGLFIEEGPIVQVKSRNRTPEVLEDKDPRVQYDGALIVMVNSFSASASEILAAALQDYERAIIVGSNSTFGKGTVQRFFDLDRALRGNAELKPLGEIKLTTQKFYRIDGGSTQLEGVTPDIVLPDNYHYIVIGEKEHDFPMKWTKIDAVEFQQNVYNLKKLPELKRKSSRRVENSEAFQMIYKNADRLKIQHDRSTYPLNLEAYQSLNEELEEYSKTFKDYFDDGVLGGVHNLEADMAAIQADESRKARNDEWIKSVKKDVYLDEVLHIIHDMIALN